MKTAGWVERERRSAWSTLHFLYLSTDLSLPLGDHQAENSSVRNFETFPCGRVLRNYTQNVCAFLKKSIKR